MAAVASYIMPLCSIEEVRADLADTELKIERMAEFKIVDQQRWDERLATLERWRARLQAQVADMEGAS